MVITDDKSGCVKQNRKDAEKPLLAVFDFQSVFVKSFYGSFHVVQNVLYYRDEL